MYFFLTTMEKCERLFRYNSETLKLHYLLACTNCLLYQVHTGLHRYTQHSQWYWNTLDVPQYTVWCRCVLAHIHLYL